jgi:acyl-CoA reductase-like NAD-dependent aldehyde dehydrogenase
MLDAILKPPAMVLPPWHQRCCGGVARGRTDSGSGLARTCGASSAAQGPRNPAIRERRRVCAQLEAAHGSASRPLHAPTSSTAQRALALDRRDDFARLIALELGKPIKDGRGEMDRVGDTLAVCVPARHARSAASCARCGLATWDRQHGDDVPGTGRRGLAITPFNAPANLLAHKLGAAFAPANTTIVKAPPQAPGVSAALVALLVERVHRSKRCKLLHGGGEVGATCCELQDVDVISFTGVLRPVARWPVGRCQTSRSRVRRQRRDDRLRRR